ncbi:VirD4-like conjugal transfer protein, CD1115 family [Ruminococcus flavefaciens]|uniref:VirD4-like conjugal transfer protein, CD1115 family n=1 Tax=Ruminococcus flavefaciens TaxID=1265 RepID=UPI0026ED8451|nr:type IV secretory system conjugative DNA transfer family protein [Ruminococcus flavefaciens]
MSNKKNKLRNGTNIKVVIYVIFIFFLLLLAFGLYAAYIIIDYEYVTGNTVKIDMESLKEFFNYISNPQMKAPINISNILLCFKYQATRLWWIYATAAFITFVAATSNTKDEYRGMEHGSASWADKYDEKEFKDKTGIPIGLDTYVSITNANKKSYIPNNLNEIVIGGSGARKTYSKIKPDIMQMIGSYVVTDPKGELYRDCAKFLKQNGYKIRVLNLIDINLSNSYNPFEYMSDEQDVLNIADLFMKNTAGDGEKEDFWSGAAQDMLVAIMVYLWKTDYELKTFGRVVRLVNSVRYKDGKIDELCELARCLKNHSIEYPNDVASVNWGSILGTPQETLGSICKVLSTRLRLWAVEDIDELTATDEMDFDSIGKEKTAIFIMIMVPTNPYKAISNIFFSQLFSRLMLIANRDYNGRLPYLVSCEIDEFKNIGKIPHLEDTLSVVRSHNIRICIVLQGISQLKAMYEKIWEGVIGQCSIFTFLGTNDQDSNEYVSKKLGKTTVRVDTRSYNRGGKSGGGGSDGENYVQRDLLGPDEISKAISRKKARKYGGKCIVFVDEYKPFILPKYNTMNHPLYELTGADSRYPKYTHNNTYINEEYASVKQQRHEHHQQILTNFFARSKDEAEQAVAEAEAEEAARDEAEQEYLSGLYTDDDFEDNETSADDLNELSDESFSELEVEDVNPIMDTFPVEEAPELADEEPIIEDFSFSEGDDE